MVHKQTVLAKFDNFGFISRCSCGAYSVNVPGVSLKLSESGLEALTQMLLDAQENRQVTQQESYEKSFKKQDHIWLVK